MPIFPWPVCPLAGHARLGQHVVAGSMMSLLEWLCWRAYQEGVCLNPHFHCKRTSPRLSVELPTEALSMTTTVFFERFAEFLKATNHHRGMHRLFKDKRMQIILSIHEP